MALKPTDNPRAGSDEAFLREVDDAVRAGDLQSYWKKYGLWTIGAIVAGLLAFGGYIVWQNQRQHAAERQGEQFIDAMDKIRAGDDKGAQVILAKLTKADQPGYRAMAQLVQANLAGEKNDIKTANAIYAKVIADGSLPDIFRNLALIRKTANEFDTLPPQKVIDQLKPLAEPGNPWFGSAGEMTALAYMKMGKNELAGPIFAQISKQTDLPETLRARAQQMAGSLGQDTVQQNDKSNGAPATKAVAKESQ